MRHGDMLTLESHADVELGRLAICAGKRKSSAMGSFRHAHIARITKRNASSRKWKRSAIRRKGELRTCNSRQCDMSWLT